MDTNADAKWTTWFATQVLKHHKYLKTMEKTVQSTANTAMKGKYKQTSPWSLSKSLNSSRHMAKLQTYIKAGFN